MTTIFGNNYNNIAGAGETPIYQRTGGGTGGYIDYVETSVGNLGEVSVSLPNFDENTQQVLVNVKQSDGWRAPVPINPQSGWITLDGVTGVQFYFNSNGTITVSGTSGVPIQFFRFTKANI